MRKCGCKEKEILDALPRVVGRKCRVMCINLLVEGLSAKKTVTGITGDMPLISGIKAGSFTILSPKGGTITRKEEGCTRCQCVTQPEQPEYGASKLKSTTEWMGQLQSAGLWCMRCKRLK